QRMVRSDKGSAGVAFTVDPETGHENIIYVTGAWGLGESVVQGAVNPDEFYFFKEAIPLKKHSLINYRIGSKETMTVYRQTGSMENSVISVETTAAMRDRPVLSDTEAMELARWCYLIERHYGMPMDIEWARDGETNELFIVQARPETVHGQQKQPVLNTFRLREKGLPVCTGKAVGKAIVSGRVCLVHTLADVEKVQQGDVIVA